MRRKPISQGQKLLILFIFINYFFPPLTFAADQALRFPGAKPMAEMGETTISLTNWFLQSSTRLQADGEKISQPGLPLETWYPAVVPSTVLGTLVENNVYRQVFFGQNLATIRPEDFAVSWWYRTEFTLSGLPWQRVATLELDGVNYRANIWVNGQKLGDASEIYGPFRRFAIDISRAVKFGERNVLAIEVIPPAKGEPTIGFVDWNPAPPDKSMGLWRGVRIRLSGDVSIKDPYIQTYLDTATLKEARLVISAEVQNNSPRPVSGRLEAEIETIKVSQEVKLEPKEKKRIVLTPDSFPQLILKNPRVWWTHDLGEPELYFLVLYFKMAAPPPPKEKTPEPETKKTTETEREKKAAEKEKEQKERRFPFFGSSPEIASDWRVVRFGIREVKDYFNEGGHRGYRLNGRQVLIRGGGWVDDIFLNVKPKKLINEILYVRHINLNALRLEGFWGTGQTFYDLCDENGILLLAGWSCQWEWENLLGKPTDKEFGGITSPEDMALIAQSFRDQVRWLRNHPSILVWVLASDLLPRPELEEEYMKILHEDDPTRPWLISAAGRKSSLSGPSGVKMNGPYDWVPPNYWFEDKKRGGAFGFNTETGPGPQMPQLETLKRILPENSLWPIDETWNFHCARGRFANLHRYQEAMNNRLGQPENIDEFLRQARYLDYEAMRAMFEAFVANRYQATGIIQWMFNSAWPKLWWQLYDYYLLPTAAFYGAKKACSPVHLIYNCQTKEIIASNLQPKPFEKARALIRVFNFDLQEKYKKETSLPLTPDSQIILDRLPEIEGLSPVYFLDLRIFGTKGELFSHNFYCLSLGGDLLDEEKSTWFVTPVKQYADLSLLRSLPAATVKYRTKISTKQEKNYITLELENSSPHLAFMVYIDVKQKRRQRAVAPIFLDDNYFTLLPGEKRTITGYFFTEDLEGDEPEIVLSGWNIQTK